PGPWRAGRGASLGWGRLGCSEVRRPCSPGEPLREPGRRAAASLRSTCPPPSTGRPSQSAAPGRRRWVDPVEYPQRSERDHLARFPYGFESEWGGSGARMGGIPARRGASDVGVDRVEVPAPVGPPLLPKVREREAEPGVVPVAEGGQDVEADQKVVV